MRITKKVLLMLTIITALLSLGYVASADGFMMRIDTVTVPAGYDGEVIVPVYIDSMPDDMQLSCFAWEFYFDSENIKFLTSDDAATFTGELISSPDDCIIGKVAPIDGSRGKFRFGWSTTRNYITETGVALYLPFYVTNAVAPGTYNIVADPFGDVCSGTESVIKNNDILADISSYLQFGAIIVEGESDAEYNDYDMVSSKASYLTYAPEEDIVVSGTVNKVNGETVTPGNTVPGSDNNPTTSTKPSNTSSPASNSGYSGGSGTLVSSKFEENTKEEPDLPAVSETFDAGTMITYSDAYVTFDTIKSQSGYVICALYKGSRLVGYEITKAASGQKVSANVAFSDIPDTAITVLMRADGTFDCYGRYPVKVSDK